MAVISFKFIYANTTEGGELEFRMESVPTYFDSVP